MKPPYPSRKEQVPRLRACRALVMAAAIVLFPASSPAQDASLATLTRDLDVLRSEIQVLQARIYQFSVIDDGSTRILNSLQEVTNSMQALTASIETIRYRLDAMEKRLDTRRVKNVPVRPSERFIPPRNKNLLGTVITDAASPLPGIARDLPVTSPPDEVVVAVVPPPEQRYQDALSLLRQGTSDSIARAEFMLREVIASVPPQDIQAASARYWLGQTFFLRGDFISAAKTFKEVYTRHPESKNAANALVKLGISLARLKNKGDACTTFDAFASKYPNPPPNLRLTIEAERQSLDCP